MSRYGAKELFADDPSVVHKEEASMPLEPGTSAEPALGGSAQEAKAADPPADQAAKAAAAAAAEAGAGTAPEAAGGGSTATTRSKRCGRNFTGTGMFT